MLDNSDSKPMLLIVGSKHHKSEDGVKDTDVDDTGGRHCYRVRNTP